MPLYLPPPPAHTLTHTQRKSPPVGGFSLIEAAIVLAVVGLVIGGIWVASSALVQRRFEQQFMEGLLALTSNVDVYFSQQSPCTAGYLGWTDPEIVKVIYPKQWVTADVNKKIHGPSMMVECPAGEPQYFRMIFWANSGFPGYVCSSLSPKISALGKKLGFIQFWGTGVYTTCQQNRDWTVGIPIRRNGF